MSMRVRFLRGTALGGVGNDAAPGDERDLADAQAANLVSLGRAVAITSPIDAPIAPAQAGDDALQIEATKQRSRKGK